MRLPWRPRRSLVFGWWRYDAAARSLVQSATGTAFRFDGRAEDDPRLGLARSINQNWLRFRIRGREGDYPLLVEWRRIPRDGRSTERPRVLRLDHLRSAALWQAETGERGPPPRDLWERIDRCAIDALNAWPYGGDPALDWDWLSLEGGWLGDTWTPRLYRSLQRLMRVAQPHGGYDKAAASPLPAPWRFVAARHPISTQGARAAVEDLRSLDRRRIADALGRLKEGRPHLAGDGAFALPFYRNDYDPVSRRTGELWLLADEAVVTDRLECAREALPGGGFRWRWDYQTLSRIGTLDRRAGGYARLPRHPLFAVRRDLAGKSFEPPDLPSRCQLYLRALGEASFGWEGDIVPLPEFGSNDVADVELSPPLETASKVYFGGGRHQWSWLTARLALDGAGEAGETLAFAFGDRTGLNSAPSRIGRFTFDPDVPALRDAGRGEALELEEWSGADEDGPMAMRFRWSGPAGDYPFLVRRALDLHGSEVLAVDQPGSAELWRSETGRDEAPPQPLWRVAMEGCVDALLCWPDHPRTGRSAPVLSRGGWIAGSWSADIVRRFDISSRTFGEEAPEAAAEQEQGWRTLGGEWPREDTGIGPALVRERYRGDLGRLLADRPSLHGIVRQDGGALLVHSRTEERPMREDVVISTRIWLYADADLALELREERPWGVRTDAFEAPVALRSGAETLWRQLPWQSAPSPLLWRRLLIACEAKAWLRGAEPNYPDKLSGGPLGGGTAGLEVRLWRE